MAEEIKEERYRPGLLDLNLQISIVKNFHHLNYQLQLTYKLEEEFEESTATVCAIQNLRGAVHFFLHEYEAACETFEKVLSKDNTNVNALRNLEIIYRQLGCWSKADEYKKRVDFDNHEVKATCFGEQAFAIMFDCHISSNEYERFKRSEKMFRLCLDEIQKSGTESEASIRWNFWYSQLLNRLMNACTKKEQQEDKINHWIDGVVQCLKVKQSLVGCDMHDTEKKHLLSVATLYLAIYCCKTDRDFKTEIKNQLPELENAEITEEVAEEFLHSVSKIDQEASSKTQMLQKQLATFKNKLSALKDHRKAVLDIVKALAEPEELFKDAMQMNNNEEVLRRYALFVKGKADVTLNDLEKAETLVSKCIKDEGAGNWFALSIKSGVILSKCKKRYEKLSSLQFQETNDTKSVTDEELCKIKDKTPETSVNVASGTTDSTSETTSSEHVWHSPLENWLQEAIEYGKKAGKINPTAHIYSEIGEAYHWLALNQIDKKMKNKYFFTSVTHYLHALQLSESNQNPYVHVCHGECLFDMQQYLPALESFKRAIECQTRRLKDVYTKLFKCYTELLREKDTDQLFADLAYWIRLGNTKFESSNWLDNILNTLKEQVQNDSIRVAEIETVFAKAAKELNDRKAFPVSDEYLIDNTTFTLCVFGETLQLQSTDYSNKNIELLDAGNLDQLDKDKIKKEIYVQNVANAFTSFKEKCLKSPANIYLKEEAFLINSFKQLHVKCKNFADLVGEKVKTDNPMLGCLLLYQTDNDQTDFNVPESPVMEMSPRELTFCVKQLNFSEPTHQTKLRDCISAFEKYLDKLSQDQESHSDKEHEITEEPKVRNTKYQYDFSIIYSEHDDDSQWVVHSLLPTLERKYGFRGYVENRDLPPGQNKFNILEMFEKCYKVIVIVTEKFCEDKWCQFVFQQALYGRLGEHNVIPIQRTSLKKMPKELSTVISLMAVQNLDWERLVKALE